jgi:hypothetical protein
MDSYRALFCLVASLATANLWASTGDVAFVAGPYTITPNANGTTATVDVAGIQNTTTNVTSGSLGFELWYSPTPYSGGTITGHQVAASFLPIGQCTSSQLQPGGECVSITVQDTLTLPPAGVYYPVLLLVEHTASCTSTSGYCTDDFVNLLQTSNGSATVTVGSSGAGTSSVTIVGNYSYVPDLAAASVQLNVAELLNSSPTYTTGTLRLELWLTLVAYSGGPINGYRVATYQITGSTNGQLGPDQYFSNISATVPLSALPSAGTYDATLVVTEYSPSCLTTDHYCIDTYGTFSSGVTIGDGANTGGNSNLSIVGTYSYSADASDTTAQLDVAEILNSSTTNTTGTLRLELWLTSTPYTGGSINGNRIATYQLTGPSQGTLRPNQDFTNITASVPLTNLPGAGMYDVTLILSEYTKNCGTSDGFCIATYGAFPNQFVVSDPTSVISNVTGHSGGGGAFGWIDCLGLTVLVTGMRLLKLRLAVKSLNIGFLNRRTQS